MGASTGAACTAQQGGRGDRQQVGAHCLGRAIQRSGLSTSTFALSASLMAAEKTLRWKAPSAFHFPTATTAGLDERSTKVCGGEKRRKNSPTARRKTWWRKCVPRDRAIYKDRHVRIIIKCPENNSPLRGRIHLRGLSFAELQNSCSSAADHTFHQLTADWLVNVEILSDCKFSRVSRADLFLDHLWRSVEGIPITSRS